MGVVKVVLTYRDYAALPQDGRRYEIHEGELSVTAAPSPVHQAVVVNLLAVFHAHVASHHRGKVYVSPIDVILSDTSVVQPDIVYVGEGRLAAISSRGIEGPPTLVVEVLSPSTAEIDRHAKFQLYARYRVPSYWMVDPVRQAIEAYALAEEGYELTAQAEGDGALRAEPFPDLAIALGSLWA